MNLNPKIGNEDIEQVPTRNGFGEDLKLGNSHQVSKKQIAVFAVLLAFLAPLPFFHCFDACKVLAWPALVPGLHWVAWPVTIFIALFSALIIFCGVYLFRNVRYWVLLLLIVLTGASFGSSEFPRSFGEVFLTQLVSPSFFLNYSEGLVVLGGITNVLLLIISIFLAGIFSGVYRFFVGKKLIALLAVVAILLFSGVSIWDRAIYSVSLSESVFNQGSIETCGKVGNERLSTYTVKIPEKVSKYYRQGDSIYAVCVALKAFEQKNIELCSTLEDFGSISDCRKAYRLEFESGYLHINDGKDIEKDNNALTFVPKEQDFKLLYPRFDYQGLPLEFYENAKAGSIEVAYQGRRDLAIGRISRYSLPLDLDGSFTSAVQQFANSFGRCRVMSVNKDTIELNNIWRRGFPGDGGGINRQEELYKQVFYESAVILNDPDFDQDCPLARSSGDFAYIVKHPNSSSVLLFEVPRLFVDNKGGFNTIPPWWDSVTFLK